jgi:hypothetical protein|tara:strand:- start:374 stop:1498 length:1125 start_codon:yes stop_codon:yes gene_type:complete
MKYLYNPVTNDLDKIADIEAAADKKEADKLARESGFLSDDDLTNYIANQPSAAESKGAFKKFVETRKKEDAADLEIENFSKEFQPNKKAIAADKYNPDEWVMHTAAMYGGEDSIKLEKHLIEDVQLLPNGEMRGMLTEKLYNAKEAINMNEKYDRNFTNPQLGKEKGTYLTANERMLANFNPTEALKYTNGGKDQENVKYMRYVKAKANRIKNIDNAKASSKKENPKLFEDILKNLGKEKSKVKTTLLTDEQKKDPKIIEVPFGPSFKEIMDRLEKEKEAENEEAYKIKLPRESRDFTLKSLMLESELTKELDAKSGIGQFDSRRRFADGANGSTPKTPQSYQKQIEDLYGIQLTGQETIAELLEYVKRLNEKN